MHARWYMLLRRFSLWFISLLLTAPVVAQAAPEINLRYIMANDQALDAEDVARLPDEQMSPMGSQHLGFSDKTVWLRARLDNRAAAPFDGYLEVAFPYLDQIRASIIRDGRRLATFERGDTLPIPEDLPKSAYPSFPVSMGPGESIDVVLEIKSSSILLVPVKVVPNKAFVQHNINYQVFYAFAFGAILAICIYVVSVYMTVRNRSYLFFVGFSLAFSALVLVGSGLGQVWFWPGAGGISDKLYFPLQGLAFALGLQFFREYLGTEYHFRKIDRLFKACIALGIISCLAQFLPGYIGRVAIAINAGPGPLLVWGIAMWLSLKGIRRARVVAIGWGICHFATVFLYLRVFDLVPYMEINHHLAMIGCLFGSLYFATALALGLRAQQERLLLAEKLNETKNDFLAGMSHELRTPLNAVIGFSEIMKSEMLGPIQPARYADYVEDIHQSSKHLLRLVNDILDISRIENGVFELDKQRFDLTLVAEEAIDMLKVTAKQANVALIARPPDVLTEVHADKRAVLQILINLIGNAIKFTEEGGWVTVTWYCDGRHVAIEVIDTGIGIPDDAREKILRPFEYVAQESHKAKAGAGLGLPLSNALIGLHGGVLLLKSEVGKGSTFTVRLPDDLKNAPNTASAPVEAAGPAIAAE